VTPVFLDTVGLLALWDKSDQRHVPAEHAFARLATDRRPLLTTTYVLLECGNAAARRPYRLAVSRLCAQLDAANLLIEPTSDDVRQAWASYQRGDAEQPGIVDYVSLAVMRRLRLTDAFTNDRHFSAAGFNVLF